METRRQFLAKSAFLSGAAAFSGGLVGAIHRALAIEPDENSSVLDAEHVVILMQENRSFDHAFGTLRGVRGFNDPRAITLPNGNPVWVQTSVADKSYAPFRLNIKDSKATWMGCLPHGWTDQVDARNEGRYDRWLDVKRSGKSDYADMPLTLGYYNRDDIPFYYALADAFTICDQHFCSSLTGTTPNRCYLWSGTIRAQQNAQSPANVLNANIDHVTNVSWPTFPERLEDLGVSWKVYQNEVSVGVGFTDEEAAWLSNFGDNPLEYFTQFNVRLTPAHRAWLEASVKSLPQKIAALKGNLASKSTSSGDRAKLAGLLREQSDLLKQIAKGRLRWNDRSFEQLTPREKNLLAKAFCTNTGDPHHRELADISYRDGDRERRVQVPKGDLLHQFRQDVANNTLPTVSWVVPPEHFSDHPNSAWYGAWYIAELLDILTQNPAVWKKTVFILTYDENDGYFDHVPPFVAPDPRRPETGRVSQNIDASLEYVTRDDEMKRKPANESRDSSIGLGYRVPMVLASPWSRGGFVCSQVFDHTSSLQFLERLLTKKLGKEVRETNISQWRRTVCGDLTSAFQPNSSGASERLSFPSRDAFIEQIDRARFKQLPSGFKELTKTDIEQIQQSPLASPHLPQQEPGVRPSCALPYELVVDGKLSDDRQRFVIGFEARDERFGERAAGSPFVVYARYGDADVRTRNYAVSSGDRLEDSWSLKEFAGGRYHLAVYGPNGFFREFRGDAQDLPLDVGFNATRAGDAEVQITNRGSRPLVVEISDVAYKRDSQKATLAPGASTKLSFSGEHSFGWYDLSVGVVGSEQFAKRYAGRIETGKPGFSDPAMGRVVS
jgi:phospholipase C